jgi:hypothetical protein
MNTTRTGKIARLPLEIREELGHRIEKNEPGVSIAGWLNSLPVVQEILREHFKSLPINDPNLSDWKKGGHQDWLRSRQARELAGRFAEQSDPDAPPVSDQFASLMALDFTRLADELLAKETDPEKRWHRLCAIHREFSRLRRDDHQATHTSLKKQESTTQISVNQLAAERQAKEQRRQELLAPMLALLQFNSLVEKLGGGDWAQAAAAYILEAQNHLPLGHFGYKNPLTLPFKPQYDPSELKLSPSDPTPCTTSCHDNLSAVTSCEGGSAGRDGGRP